MPLSAEEKAATILSEINARRQSDPLSKYQPHAKQNQFIQAVLRGDKTECWFIGANRSGKSSVGARCGAELARYGDPNARPQYFSDGMTVTDRATSGWVVGLDSNVNREVIQPKYFDNGEVMPGEEPFIPKREIKTWRPGDQTLHLKNGSVITWKSAEQGRIKFQGAAKDWIHFDEEPPYPIYEECVIRVGSKKLRVFGTCTLLPPEGQLGGVSWIFSEIIQPWKDGKMPNVELVSASIYDNPHIPEQEIKRLESIYTPGSVNARIRLNGEWLPGISGSRAYTSFDRQIHVQSQPEVNPRRPIMWTWDFNVEPMVSLVLQRDLVDGLPLYRVIREFVQDEGSIPDMCDIFRHFYPQHYSEVIVYGDATGKGRSAQTSESDYTLIANAMRSYGVPIRFRIPESNPPVGDRVNALNRILRDENGEVRMQVDPSCRELIADLEQVLRDNNGGIKKTTNRKDPYVSRTHTSDALGYFVCYEEPVTPKPPGGSRRASIIKQPGYSFR